MGGKQIWGGGGHRAGEQAGRGLCSVEVSWCGQSREKENKGGWKFSRRHREPFEALEHIFFLIRAGLGQILPGRSSHTGDRRSASGPGVAPALLLLAVLWRSGETRAREVCWVVV